MNHLIESLEGRRLLSASVGPAPHFGDHGHILPVVGSQAGNSNAIATLNNGDFVIAGAVYPDNASTSPFLNFYKPNGKLDRSMGNDGQTVINFGSNSYFDNVFVQSDGSFFVLGGSQYRPDVFFHFTSSGKLDSGFGQNGQVSIATAFPTDVPLYPAAVTSANGEIVVAAASYVTVAPGPFPINEGPVVQLVLLKMDSKGNPIASFGDNGKLITGISVVPTAVRIDARGRIVACGSYFQSGSLVAIDEQIVEAVRFSATGKQDMSFGTQGVVQAAGTQITFDPQGRLVVVNSPLQAFYVFAVAQDPIATRDASASSMGSIINIGYPVNESVLSRYTQNGRIDDTFGIGGQTILKQHDGSTFERAFVSFTTKGMTITTDNYEGSSIGAGSEFVGFYKLGINGRFGGGPFMRETASPFINGAAAVGDSILTIGNFTTADHTTQYGILAFNLR